MRKVLIILTITVLVLAACGSASPAESAQGTYVRPVETPAPETTVPPTAPVPTTVPETSPTESETETVPTTPEETTTVDHPQGGTGPAAETTEPEETTHMPSVIASGYAPGEELPTSETAEGQLGVLEEDDMLLTYKGMKLRAGDVFDYHSYEEAWGVPQIEKGAACIGGGFDMNYYYGEGFSVYTVGEGENQVVYDIYLTEEGYSTVKGAVIGVTTREELTGIYGEPNASLGATDRYTLGDGIYLSFTFSGGVLTDIDYNDSNQR